MTEPDSALAFEILDDQPGFEIVDRIEQEHCLFQTAEDVAPEPAGTAPFLFPVDRACRVTVGEVTLPTVGAAYVRNGDGDIVAEATPTGSETFPEGRYSLELLTQFKAYIEVEGEFEISVNPWWTHVHFAEPTTITVGALSNHDRPAATVTTTADPVDMMAAVETFSSSLKTTKPDRSLPSLRGHPPAVDLGESLEIPAGIERPETGVRLELPVRRGAVYVATPLAYYLGASLEPGATPRLVTDTGFEYVLADERGFETAVEQTLKQVFFLDCVTRSEGLYDVALGDRKRIEPYVDLDFAALYDKPIADQIAAYLDVPFEVVEDHVPEWRLTTHVEPAPETIEQLPFVVNDLAIVRTESANLAATSPAEPAMEGLSRDEVFTRSAGSASSTRGHEYVEPEASSSMEQAWIGENIPIGASKLTREAFDNRLDREPTEGDISITIVLNDPRMDEERNLVDSAYGNRANLPFDVDVHRDVTVDGLADILRTDTAFLHYIGHIDYEGFECRDGRLDIGALADAKVQAFMLNACNSYEQGLSLVEAGAIGGIVTLNDVINEGAVRIGESIARLLNAGFPLRAALTIARGESVLGGQYIVVGDGGMTVAQPESGTPVVLDVAAAADGFEVDIEMYTTDVYGLGAFFQPNLEDIDEYYLNSGRIESVQLSEAELRENLQLEDLPVRVDGELRWSSTLDVSEIP